MFLHPDLHFHWSQIIVDYYKILSKPKSWISVWLTSHPKHQQWQQLLRLKDLLTTPTPGCVTLSFMGTYLFPMSDEWMANNSWNPISLFSCSVPFFPNLVIYSSAVRYWKGMTERISKEQVGWILLHDGALWGQWNSLTTDLSKKPPNNHSLIIKILFFTNTVIW